MIELGSRGKTIEDIANVLKQVPIHPRIIAAIKTAHAAGYILLHVSYTLYIIREKEHTKICFSHSYSLKLFCTKPHRCDLRIVSDANVFFIETILEHVGLRQCFTEINTNPSSIDEEGRLRISPYHDFHDHPPHACNLCPPNMCKVCS